jgi:hypothetical protein
MANYSVGVYGASTYGQTAKIGYTVLPMSVTTINFQEAYVYWQLPSGTYSRVRLVRNQNSYPEHAEDGVIIWEDTTMSRTLFRDGEDNSGSIAVISGKPIYYTMFLFTGDSVWVNAGSTSSVIPSNHGLQDKFMDMLPRVFTSKEQSPLAQVDTTSALYQMMDGFTFTMEDFLTHLDLLNPDHTRISTPAIILPLEQVHVGLDPEFGIPVKNQKQLVRESVYNYTHKGTKSGLTSYIESLTGYYPSITLSSNLLLSVQDSTFYKSIGNWQATGGTLASATDLTPPSIATAIDEVYTCKITASGAGSMTLGLDSPILKGVPIVPGKTYVLSAEVKSPSSAGTITPSIVLVDVKGNAIGSPIAGSATTANNTWKSSSVSTRAPQYSNVAVQNAVGASGSIVYTTFDNHKFIVGDNVTVIGFATTSINTASSTVTAVTDTTFTINSSFVGASASTEVGNAYNHQVSANYAGIKFAWSAAGTYYIDTVSLQEGTSPSYDEARAVNIFLSPNKVNLINNPSFEANVTDSWTKTGSAVVTQDTDVDPNFYSGQNSAKLVATGDWTFTANTSAVTVGQYYTVSANVKGTDTVTMTITAGSDTMSSTIPASTVWGRYAATMVVPSNSTATSIQVSFSGPAGTYHIDGVQLEQAFKATEYFDGYLPEAFGTVWTGTPNNSPSATYFTKPIKMYRLGHTLNDWVPKGTFWRISSYAGLEYNNLQV